jgi:hypothetical protein
MQTENGNKMTEPKTTAKRAVGGVKTVKRNTE